MSESLFDSQNAGYVQLLYEEYARNPDSVPEEWRRFFARGTEATVQAGLLVPESLSSNGYAAGGRATPGAVAAAPVEAAVVPAESAGVEEATRLLPVVARATSFVQAYRDHGHMLARIDPLGSDPPGHPQLDPSFFGTSVEELEQIPAEVVMGPGPRDETLADTLGRLREAYCGWIGYEFEHLEDPARVRWLWDQVESGIHTRPLEPGQKVRLLQRLTEVEGFETFLHRVFLGQKRFSVEGTDMLIPILDLALEEAASSGARHVVLGMAHRGRLNVLAHIVGIGYSDILREFEGVYARDALNVPGTGDVKYHHGAAGEHELPDGSSIRVTLAPNPSHLEFVNPVVLGMTRQLQFGGEGREAVQDTSAVVPILIHGDAAFAAEGVVAETLNLGRLRGYTVGGTVHIIVDNQIGFTTDPDEGRSTRYASSLAKGYDFPIIHVNADRPEACLAAVRLAMAYRAEYGDDVVIDLVGYRRHGHNEGDEPAYTQPLLYQTISRHSTVRTLWARQLEEDGVLDEHDAGHLQDQVAENLREVLDHIQDEEPRAGGAPRPGPSVRADVDTGVGLDGLMRINETALGWPEGFHVHPKLARQLEHRREEFGADTKIEWAHAETLAFGSLLEEGYVIRLTGQDSQRGTFSQRHLVLHDVETGEKHTPLAGVGTGRLEVYNSPLSEAAPLGYDYGYSVASKRDLVLWEAQFGDFVNAAQVAVDQFVASGKEKWDQYANLTLLLPHAYEGQGPEHSSARLERFLQLCAEDNLGVTYPSTPAQYFHLLRRQAHARPEHPLVVMTPKSLLRLPAASSAVSELTEGRFRPVIEDPGGRDREEITRLVLCSGKVYYDIQGDERREERTELAVGRL
ncbi:MAG TPA: 2-oxoglutarate dehydrogenase E1 component, partial [Longimicrobiales bacterium]|nr:2-oxoglutarate dehydrogenase E1 component [Longimicrobiales bacterium]